MSSVKIATNISKYSLNIQFIKSMKGVGALVNTKDKIKNTKLSYLILEAILGIHIFSPSIGDNQIRDHSKKSN